MCKQNTSERATGMADEPDDRGRELRREFARLNESELRWRNKADDLRLAAEAVWESRKQGPVYLMLCGMSLEALYKAIAVVRGKEVQHSHDLLGLAARAGLRVDVSEEGALELLTAAIVWDGRYPVPRKWRHLRGYRRLFHSVMSDRYLTASSVAILRPNSALDWEHFCRLWRGADNFFWEARDPRRES